MVEVARSTSTTTATSAAGSSAGVNATSTAATGTLGRLGRPRRSPQSLRPGRASVSSGNEGLFQRRGPAAVAGSSVAARALEEDLLRLAHIRVLARPRPQRRGRTPPAVGEGQLPRLPADPVHRVEMAGGELVALAAREESDPRYRGRNDPAQAGERALGHLLHPRLLRAGVPGQDHVRLQHHALEPDALLEQRVEDLVQHPPRDLLRALDRMVAVHQHLGLDDRDDAGLLAERGVARQGVGVQLDRAPGGQGLARDRDHRSPLGEARPELAVLRQAPSKAVESLCDGFARRARERLRTGVDLDAGENIARGEVLREGRAGAGGLAQRLVEHDHSAHVLGHAVRGEQQLAERAARLSARLDPGGLEPLVHRARALIGGQDSPPGSDHRGRDHLDLANAHRPLLSAGPPGRPSTILLTAPPPITIDSTSSEPSTRRGAPTSDPPVTPLAQKSVSPEASSSSSSTRSSSSPALAIASASSSLCGASRACIPPPSARTAHAVMTPSGVPPTPINRSASPSGRSASSEPATSPSGGELTRAPVR